MIGGVYPPLTPSSRQTIVSAPAMGGVEGSVPQWRPRVLDDTPLCFPKMFTARVVRTLSWNLSYISFMVLFKGLVRPRLVVLQFAIVAQYYLMINALAFLDCRDLGTSVLVTHFVGSSLLVRSS